MTRLTVIGKQKMKVSDLYFKNEKDADKWIKGFYYTHVESERKEVIFFEYFKSFFFERKETKEANDLVNQIKRMA